MGTMDDVCGVSLISPFFAAIGCIDLPHEIPNVSRRSLNTCKLDNFGKIIRNIADFQALSLPLWQTDFDKIFLLRTHLELLVANKPGDLAFRHDDFQVN